MSFAHLVLDLPFFLLPAGVQLVIMFTQLTLSLATCPAHFHSADLSNFSVSGSFIFLRLFYLSFYPAM